MNMMRSKYGAAKVISCLIVMVCLVLLIPMTAQAKLNKRDGVNYFGQQKETYYNLSMKRIYERADADFGSHHKKWTREDGCKMCGPYIICAADWRIHPYGSNVESSLGTCIVLDTGGFASGEPTYQIDIAVNW